MITVIGVRFRTAGKIYYFDPAGRQIKTGDHVIVETARGIEYGYVVLGNREVDESKVVPPLKSVIRMATDEDETAEARNKQKEPALLHIFMNRVSRLFHEYPVQMEPGITCMLRYLLQIQLLLQVFLNIINDLSHCMLLILHSATSWSGSFYYNRREPDCLNKKCVL